MKILFTGASSFTGHWFVNRLVQAGHNVRATFTRESVAAYGDDVRGRRVQRVVELSTPIFSCCFGDERFLDCLKSERVDLVCHHAADATNYKSPAFDVCAAVANNTRGVRDVLQLVAADSSAALLLTGSVFEGGEGEGSEGLPSFSPYGLSKSLTAEVFSYYCGSLRVPMGKFVIPNPFGPWEDARFTSYLMRTWRQGDLATVRTPAYIRDNIHVSLLAATYVTFAETLVKTRGCIGKINPSGYVESQGDFAERVAREVRTRTGWKCQLDCARQSTFDEPRDRHNTQPIAGAALGWNESVAWDEFVRYYEGE